jgi:hypothetical protein
MEKELLNIRQKILNTSLPLLIDGDSDDKQGQFELLLQVIQSGTISDKSIYQKAYSVANSIEDESARLDALMQLLSEVDYELDNQAPDKTSKSEK